MRSQLLSHWPHDPAAHAPVPEMLHLHARHLGEYFPPADPGHLANFPIQELNDHTLLEMIYSADDEVYRLRVRLRRRERERPPTKRYRYDPVEDGVWVDITYEGEDAEWVQEMTAMRRKMSEARERYSALVDEFFERNPGEDSWVEIV